MRLSTVKPKGVRNLTKVYLILTSMLLFTSQSYSPSLWHTPSFPYSLPSSGLSFLICKRTGFGMMTGVPFQLFPFLPLQRDVLAL